MSTTCILVAQVIRTEWSKRSRGAPAATLRNAVPERFALPARAEGARSGSLLQRLYFGERNDFQSPVVERFDGNADAHAAPRTPAHSPIGTTLTL